MTKEQLISLEQVNEFRLTESEETRMMQIFDDMAQSEKVLEKYDTDRVEVMVHVMPMTNILREDRAEQYFSRESLLEGAPEHTEDSWQVPRLVK